MARQTTDQLYIELDYYYPEEYYTYQAYAESALSCSSTIDCTISNVRGADLVAFSNAALTADAVVTRSAEVTLQATASIDQFVGNLYALRSASLSSEFAQTADANRLREPQIALNGEFTFNALISISGAVEGEGNWSSQFTVNVTPDLFKDMGANLYADAVCDPDGVQRIRDVDSTQSVEFTQTTNNYRIVQGNIAIDALFTPSMTVEAVRNAFAVLDSTSALAVVANANRSADIALSSIVNQSLQGDRFRDYVVNANSQFAITVTALRIKKSSVSVSSAFTATALVRRRAGLTTNASAQFTVSCIPKEIQGVIQLTLFNTASLTANVDAFIEPTVYLFNFTQVSTDQTPYGFYNSTYPKTAIRGYGGYDPNQIMSGRSYDTGVGEYYFDVRDINQDWERELTVNLPSNYQSISSRDFTIECLVYVNKSNIGTPYEPILTGSISRYDISLYPTNVVKFGNFYTSSNVGIGWHHLAYSRNGNTLRIFIDGTKVYEGSDTSTSSITSHVWGGYWGSGDSGGNQYTKLDEIRYTLDYSRYNANFIAPIFGTTFNWPGFEYAGAQLQSNFNINVIAYNVQFSGGALTSQASLNASVDKYRSGQAQFTSAFTETVTGRVSYDPTIGISSNFQETATPNKIVGVTANLSSAFTTTTTARK
jgi:hypothetical protein